MVPGLHGEVKFMCKTRIHRHELAYYDVSSSSKSWAKLSSNRLFGTSMHDIQESIRSQHPLHNLDPRIIISSLILLDITSSSSNWLGKCRFNSSRCFSTSPTPPEDTNPSKEHQGEYGWGQCNYSNGFRTYLLCLATGHICIKRILVTPNSARAQGFPGYSWWGGR